MNAIDAALERWALKQSGLTLILLLFVAPFLLGVTIALTPLYLHRRHRGSR